jgi:hypothetical protein
MSCRVGEPAAATSFGQHAEESLQFIRRTMGRSSTFTTVPGLGAIGLAAAILAANQRSAARWLVVWLLAAAVALGIAVTTMWRNGWEGPLGSPTRSAHQPITSHWLTDPPRADPARA